LHPAPNPSYHYTNFRLIVQQGEYVHLYYNRLEVKLKKETAYKRRMVSYATTNQSLADLNYTKPHTINLHISRSCKKNKKLKKHNYFAYETKSTFSFVISLQNYNKQKRIKIKRILKKIIEQNSLIIS